MTEIAALQGMIPDSLKVRSSKIMLDSLEVETDIGFHDFEIGAPQRLLVTVELWLTDLVPPADDDPHGAWDYHEHFIAQSKPKPLRIWMHVGSNDNRSTDEEATYHNWVMANQRMAEVLKSKKYHYQFVFAQKSGHVDGRVVNQTLPAALEYVWKGYPIKTPKAPKAVKSTH